MADKQPEAEDGKQAAAPSTPEEKSDANNGDAKPIEQAASTLPEQSGTPSRKQKVSGILKTVLESEVGDAPPGSIRRVHYPWFVDVILGFGLLIAVGAFSYGLFRMYIAHQAQQCLIEGNYQAAIHLLKGSPMPDFISFMGSRDEDPSEMLARALYMDAMRKITDENDVKGAKDELQQIRAGTHEFEQAQKILLENFEPSSTQLTGGVVQNDATTGTSK